MSVINDIGGKRFDKRDEEISEDLSLKQLESVIYGDKEVSLDDIKNVALEQIRFHKKQYREGKSDEDTLNDVLDYNSDLINSIESLSNDPKQINNKDLTTVFEYIFDLFDDPSIINFKQMYPNTHDIPLFLGLRRTAVNVLNELKKNKLPSQKLFYMVTDYNTITQALDKEFEEIYGSEILKKRKEGLPDAYFPKIEDQKMFKYEQRFIRFYIENRFNADFGLNELQDFCKIQIDYENFNQYSEKWPNFELLITSNQERGSIENFNSEELLNTLYVVIDLFDKIPTPQRRFISTKTKGGEVYYDKETQIPLDNQGKPPYFYAYKLMKEIESLLEGSLYKNPDSEIDRGLTLLLPKINDVTVTYRKYDDDGSETPKISSIK